MNDITIARHTPPYPFEAYTHVVRPLTTEEGGGFLISFPELSGCISDGETVDRSKREGVSLNTLVVSYVAAGVAHHV